MNLARCECPKGSDGSPCKHQYLLWLKQLSNVSKNILPIFDAKERQEIAKFAGGILGPDELYEEIRDRFHTVHVADKSNTEPAEYCSQDETFGHIQENELDIESTMSQSRRCEVEEALTDAFEIMKGKLDTGPNFVAGVLKFSKRVLGMSSQTQASAVNCFSSGSTSSSLKVSKATRKAKRNKIKVQQ